MRTFVVFFTVCLACFALASTEDQKSGDSAENCYKGVQEGCGEIRHTLAKNTFDKSCTSKFGSFVNEQNELHTYLSNFAIHHIHYSNKYLLLASHFSNYQLNRPGFEKLFRELSDSKWQTAIDIIQHITKRGGSMNFAMPASLKLELENNNSSSDIFELHSLGFALDTEKLLATKTIDIHKKATKHDTHHHDPEIAQYLEEKFLEQQPTIIRQLAGHVNDVKSFLESKDRTLALYLFDEYLQKA